jgi:hypothetical protein
VFLPGSAWVVCRKTDPISFHDLTFPLQWAMTEVTLRPLSMTLVGWGLPPLGMMHKFWV